MECNIQMGFNIWTETSWFYKNPSAQLKNNVFDKYQFARYNNYIVINKPKSKETRTMIKITITNGNGKTFNQYVNTEAVARLVARELLMLGCLVTIKNMATNEYVNV